MNIFSLFEDEKLATILSQVIKNERPKSDLEKTKWWDVMTLQAFSNKCVCNFINRDWPNINPRFILDELSCLLQVQEQPKIHDCLKDAIDIKLIETIKEEQEEVSRKHLFNLPVNGPKLKPLRVNTKNSGEIDCVAINEDMAYSDIYSFLISLGETWIKGLKHFSPHINCDNQNFTNNDKENEDRDSELAEVIFSNFPKTFDYCEKDYHLYICSWNWNFTKDN